MTVKRDSQLMAFLRSVPIFHDLRPASMEQVFELLDEQQWAPGATLFREGDAFGVHDSGRRMYVLREGEVEVLRRGKDGQDVGFLRLGPGETFGEMALVELQPRSATVIARKPSKTYSLTNLDLYTLFKVDPNAYVFVLQNICRMLSRRLRKADGRIVELLDGDGAHAAGRAPASGKGGKGGARRSARATPVRKAQGTARRARSKALAAT